MYDCVYIANMRIQKYLSQQKILSRRETEDYIRKGLIKVNGKIIQEMGVQIDPVKDKVEILQIGKADKERVTAAIYKPRGIVSSRNKKEGKTVFEIFPQFKNLNVVGRLDKESEGLLLLSNDGIVTSAVTGSDHLIEKEYQVTVQENVGLNKLKKMEEGIKIDGRMTLPAKTELLNSHNFLVILKEGRKHQIRRMCAALNLTVTSLKRLRVGNINLKGISFGSYRILSPKEAENLKKLAA